jgi:hypothetical protein
MAGAEREVVGVRSARVGFDPDQQGGGGWSAGQVIDTAPATDDARRWQGWGTALKPAHEPIVVARKPLSGTVASNVTTWGTGALNIDACRVAGPVPLFTNRSGDAVSAYGDGLAGSARTGETGTGRWPSNVVLSHSPWCEVCECGARGPHEPGDYCYDTQLDCVPGCPVAELDKQSGVSISTDRPRRNTAEAHNRTSSMGQSSGDWTTSGHADSGGASRFFPVFRYEAKAPTSERPRIGGGSAIAANLCAKCGRQDLSGSRCQCPEPEWIPRNGGDVTGHPTVKPLNLLRWLVRLVCPPGGTVLDPFAGSGTTAEACVLEWFHCIAIERDETYLPLIRQRITKPLQPGLPGVTEDPAAPVRPVARPKPARVEPAEPPAEQPDLFTLSE